MNKFYETLTNLRGDVLFGYRAQVVDETGASVDIYRDRNGTRFTDGSGNIVNYAEASSDTGMAEFYWNAATGHILQITDSAGELARPPIVGFGDNYVLNNLSGDLPTTVIDGLDDTLTAIDNDLATKAATADLAANDPTKGATIVGLPQGGNVANAIRWVVPEMFGAVGDAVQDSGTGLWSGTDDSAAIQDAIDYLGTIGGGMLLIQSNYLCGGITIPTERIVIQGNSRCNRLVVKNGTTGFTVSASWVHFRNLGIISQGTEDDGLGTNGILYTKGTGSIGHVFNYDLDVDNFSGVGVEFRNALDLTMISCFHRHCGVGLKFGRNGTGGADFSTTVRLINVYAISCMTYGVQGEYVYRSVFNVIGEYNGTAGIYNNIGDITLDRCYFENNGTLGAQLIDTGGQDINCYSNDPVTDVVSRTRSVTGNTDWYTVSQYKGDCHTKRMGLQNAWGRDTKWMTGVGTTANIGLKYGDAIVPRVYGPDLLDQKAWASETSSEFTGWSPANSGYGIIHGSSGIRGMRQSVSLDSTKTYVIDFTATNVTGNTNYIVHVDGVVITPGAPFTVASTGSKVVRAFANQTGASEYYINAFRLYEVLENQSFIAKTADRLSRAPTQRGDIYAAAAPTTGTWAVGERVWNSAPTAGGTMGWVCVTAGTPGTWKTFGAVAA